MAVLYFIREDWVWKENWHWCWQWRFWLAAWIRECWSVQLIFQQKRVWNRQWKRNCSQLRKTVLRNWRMQRRSCHPMRQMFLRQNWLMIPEKTDQKWQSPVWMKRIFLRNWKQNRKQIRNWKRNRSWKRSRKVWQKILDLRKWKKLSLRMAVKMHYLEVRIMQDLNGTDCAVLPMKKVRLRSKRSLTMTIMIRITIR